MSKVSSKSMSGKPQIDLDLVKQEPVDQESLSSLKTKSSIKVVRKLKCKIFNEKLSSSFRILKLRKSVNKLNKISLIKKRRRSRKKFLNYTDFLNDIDETNDKGFMSYLDDKLVEKKLPWETYLRKRKGKFKKLKNSGLFPELNSKLIGSQENFLEQKSNLNVAQQSSNSKKEKILKFERLYRKRKYIKVTRFDLARKINDRTRSIKSKIGLKTLLLTSSQTDDSPNEHHSSQVDQSNSEMTEHSHSIAAGEIKKEPGILAYQDVIARVLKCGTARKLL